MEIKLRLSISSTSDGEVLSSVCDQSHVFKTTVTSAAHFYSMSVKC